MKGVIKRLLTKTQSCCCVNIAIMFIAWSAYNYQNVFKKNSLHWLCAHCKDKVMKNNRNDREIKERCAEFFFFIKLRAELLYLKVK